MGIVFFTTHVWSATTAQIDTARINGLAWLFQHQQGDGSWSAAKGLEIPSTSAVVDAFMNADIQRGNSFNAAVAMLANTKAVSVDAKVRQFATLKRAGDDVTNQQYELQAASNHYKGWGTLPNYGSGPADTALALTVLLDTNYNVNDAMSTVCTVILPKQQSNGGWSYISSGTNMPASSSGASIAPTAYVILLLQKINTTITAGLTCGTTSYSFSTVITNAINFLVSKQSVTDHGFGDNGVSGVLETALAYKAISYVNPTHSALALAQDYLIAKQSNGAWNNDPLQTALVLQTFPVVVLTDTARDGIPDAVKTALHITTTTDVRNLLPSNGLSVIGVTTAELIANAGQNKVFNTTLTGTGGTGPYTFRLISGNLPDGLILASNGVISGTPATVGPFNFTYEVRDSLNNTNTITGQIMISAIDNIDTDIPMLPEWALILMGGGFVLLMIKARRHNLFPLRYW